MRGRALQREIARLKDEYPLCVLCLAHGRTTVAAVRDHIQPLAEGGLDIPSNTQMLCHGCHDAKTAEEAKRGVRPQWKS